MKKLIAIFCLLALTGCAAVQAKNEDAGAAKPRIDATVSNHQVKSQITLGIPF